MQGWFQSVWAQVFRDRLVMRRETFLSTNFFVGLFAIVVIVAGAHQPERTNLALTAVAAMTVATHVGGYPASMLAPDRLDTLLFVQGLCLFIAAAALTGTSIWLAWQTGPLTNFRYAPGLAVTLLTYAALELHFFGPPAMRRMNVRRLAIAVGLVAELGLAAALVWRLVRAPG